MIFPSCKYYINIMFYLLFLILCILFLSGWRVLGEPRIVLKPLECRSKDFLRNSFYFSVDCVHRRQWPGSSNRLQQVRDFISSYLQISPQLKKVKRVFVLLSRRLQVLYRCCVVSQCIGDMLTAVFVGLNSLSNFIQDTIDWVSMPGTRQQIPVHPFSIIFHPILHFFYFVLSLHYHKMLILLVIIIIIIMFNEFLY